MIELSIFTKNKPELNEALAGLLGVEYVRTVDQTIGTINSWRDYRKVYRWLSLQAEPDEQRSFINLEVEMIKSTWSCDTYEADEEIATAGEKGEVIPEGYINKLRRDQGVIAADRETYRLLRIHPELASTLPHFEPIWGLVKFARGGELYTVSLETPAWASKEAVTKMCQISQTIGSKFNGIIWSGDLEEFGPVDPNRLYDMYQSVSEGVGGLLTEMGMEFRPVDPGPNPRLS